MGALEGRMRAGLWIVITAACALADNQNRRTKLPYVADAVGNSLPPPSNAPATVGSPVTLLTPDRYEFYTFDESGELVKRLMTLEEIQAIVAAGEETEGLVTFANDNQPTIAFNFTQPSQTKVHSVVTNVQNVLKAQMEAQKNKPNIQPTLDTPDVSDSWSLILPSIFGNTGVDIVPDKTSGSFITPETETFEIDDLNNYKNSQSKESNEIPTVSTFQQNNEIDMIPAKKTENSLSTTASTLSSTPSYSSTSVKLTSTTENNYFTTTTKKPEIKFTNKVTTSKTHSSSATSTEPTMSSTTIKPSADTLHNAISMKPNKTRENMSDEKNVYNITNQSQNTPITTKEPIQYERISTFLPSSTVAYITEKTTNKPIMSTQKSTNDKNYNDSITTSTVATKITTSTTSHPVLTNKENEKLNVTTVTTQSVSPSTTVSSTEIITTQKTYTNTDTGKNDQTNDQINDKTEYDRDNQSIIPMFDVAQSISQIASDLGNNYVSIPTSNSFVDTTNTSSLAIESKENIEMEIPTESGDGNEVNMNATKNVENFVKISTLDPQEQTKNTTLETIELHKEGLSITSTTSLPISTSTVMSPTRPNIDAVISESMGDLLSQVVHGSPDPSSLIFSQNNTQIAEITTTTPTPASFTASQKSKVDIKEIDTAVTPQSIVNNAFSKKPEDTTQKVNNKTKIENNELVSSTIIKSNVSKIKIETNTLKENTKNEHLKNSILPSNMKNLSMNNSEKKEEKIIISNNQDLSETLSSNVKSVNMNSSAVVNNHPSINNNKSSLNDKAEVHNTNKLFDKVHKQKINEEVPKIEDFKKKIQKVNIDEKELANDRNNSWKLIPSVNPPKPNEIGKDKHKVEAFYTPDTNENKNIVLEFPKENQGLEVTTRDLGDDILQFTELCNELAFRYWNVMIDNVDKKRSLVFSPYSITSMLAMMFMGAKGATSGEMNEILRLDDMVTFNPHFTLKNISDSIETSPASGVVISAFIRELFSERNKGKMLTFYKERAQHFYNGHVEEINYKLIGDVIRRRTNLLVKRYTWGKIPEYLKTNSITMSPPLAAFSANLFYTDCTGSSVEGRDGEMYFVVSPNVRQRRLVPVPAVVYKSNFLAGYDPVLDATAAALGNTNSVVSTLFLMPGQQGNIVHADDLEKLEKRFLDATLSSPAWNGLLRTLLPRVGLELQIPRFSHKSLFNVTSTLKKMGLKELFDADHADLGGLNGPSKDLYLSDMLQLTTFATCAESGIGGQHHVEDYPDTQDYLRKRRTSRWIMGWDEPRDYQRAFHDPHDVGEAMHLPLHLRPRQARLPARSSQPARLKFDRPFLYFVRHNPSGMILYVGRYNPRLLP
ncbi:serine-rich adhesin for platelets [Pararge aegeria]|uniref:serine-rich adhesin for platelets n=1 Tax=Pararge aegeria TaxID=116150 RepID=UPI0019D163EA|nr:serine-rich adhesin for platelets [Pararge aegeria]